MSRNNLFGAPTKEVLLENAESLDASARWAAAIELGQIGDFDAAVALWRLKNDYDENVRSAAEIALGEIDKETLNSALMHLEVNSLVDEQDEREIEFDGEFEEHIAWKIRPLPDPKADSEWAVDAAIINIVTVEGPVTGSRLLSLYGQAVYPNAPRKISKFRVKQAIERLMRRNIITRSDTSRSAEIDTWVLHRVGFPGVVVRKKGLRQLTEIPANEVQALIDLKLFGTASDNKDRKFRVVMEHYEIEQKDFHLIGALYEKEWSALLR